MNCGFRPSVCWISDDMTFRQFGSKFGQLFFGSYISGGSDLFVLSLHLVPPPPLMTFSVLRALHSIIGEALGDIEAVYALHGSHDKPPSGLDRDKAPTPDPSGNYSSTCSPVGPNHRPTLSTNSLSHVYASPPPSPCIKTENSTDSLPQQSLDFPSLDAPCNPTSLSEMLTHHLCLRC